MRRKKAKKGEKGRKKASKCEADECSGIWIEGGSARAMYRPSGMLSSIRLNFSFSAFDVEK
jgi:hypothetical protein